MHHADTVCQSMLHACDMDCAKVSASDRAEIPGRGNERKPAEEASKRGSYRPRSTIAEDGRRGEELTANRKQSPCRNKLLLNRCLWHRSCVRSFCVKNPGKRSFNYFYFPVCHRCTDEIPIVLTYFLISLVHYSQQPLLHIPPNIPNINSPELFHNLSVLLC